MKARHVRIALGAALCTVLLAAVGCGTSATTPNASSPSPSPSASPADGLVVYTDEAGHFSVAYDDRLLEPYVSESAADFWGRPVRTVSFQGGDSDAPGAIIVSRESCKGRIPVSEAEAYYREDFDRQLQVWESKGAQVQRDERSTEAGLVLVGEALQEDGVHFAEYELIRGQERYRIQLANFGSDAEPLHGLFAAMTASFVPM